jgi:hypothetical protein
MRSEVGGSYGSTWPVGGGRMIETGDRGPGAAYDDGRGAQVNLDPDSIEAVAQRVAELLRDGGLHGELIDAAEVARRFGVTRDYVYAHAGRLGAISLSNRPKARLRFDPRRVAEAMGVRKAGSGGGGEERPRSGPRGQRRRRRKQVGSILPVHGKQP